MRRVVEMFRRSPISFEARTDASSFDERLQQAKYLTAPRLLRLQISDADFRRAILAQSLVLLNCVRNELAAAGRQEKPPDTPEQRRMDDTRTTLGDLVREQLEALPNGDAYLRTMDTVLEGEFSWAEWKRDGCKDAAFTGRAIDAPVLPAAAGAPAEKAKGGTKRPRPGAPDWKIRLGSEELNRIWNETESNGDAMVNVEAAAPAVPEFLSVMHMQAQDPTVEESDKVYNDEIYQWKALRLLSRSGIRWPNEMPIREAVESGFGSLAAPAKEEEKGAEKNGAA